jgi:hypothetical protein
MESVAARAVNRRMRGVLLAMAAALVLAAAAPAPAAAQAPRTVVTEALGLVRAGRAAEAYTRLKPLEPRYSGDPEFDYVLGLAALESGKPGEAALILSRLVKNRPDLLPPRAELGRAYLTLGDLPAARQTFGGLVADRRLPQQVRDTLGRYIQDIDRVLAQRRTAGGAIQPGTTRIGGFVETRSGYDTNVNAATNQVSILIPAFAPLGPAQLDPSGRARSDAFTELSGGISIVHALSAEAAIYLNAVATGKVHARYNNFDVGLVGAEAGYARDLGVYGRFTVAAIGQYYALDYKTYRNAIGAAALWNRTTEGGLTTTLSATYSYFGYVGDSARNANRFVAGVTVGQRFEAAGNLYVYGTMQAGLERTTSTATDHFSHNLVGLRVGAERPLSANLSLFGSASAEWRAYQAPYPLFFVERRDAEYTGALGLDWRITESMRLRPVVNYAYVNSNIALFDQKRWIFSLALRREW